MPAAASGADAGAKGEKGRAYTVEQKAAVIRIRRCQHTAFYEILGIESSSSDGEIKKAYRKLSLLTHPDKNGYDGAEDAFKMVSRAFQILSDAEKKAKYDKFGGDPDNRFGPGAAPSSPFSGFARSPDRPRGPMFDDEISPEELFQRFFGGGGMGGGFGPFGNDMFGGQQFVFNLGGGPGFRVHQFAGGRPRRRPREAGGQEAPPQSFLNILVNLLPVIILFILPLLSSLLSGDDSAPSGPEVRLAQDPPYTTKRSMPGVRLDYYVNPADVDEYSSKMLRQLDRNVERRYITDLQHECHGERQVKTRLINQAQGWFLPDREKLAEAHSMELRSCQRLKSLGISLESYY